MKTETWKQWIYQLKKHTYALFLASQDTRVPLLAKMLIALVVAYALSPIDLIPDFIPIIGYLDDLLLLPIAIWLAIQLIPKPIWHECQAQAELHVFKLPQSRWAGAVIILIWLLAIIAFTLWAFPLLNVVISQ